MVLLANLKQNSKLLFKQVGRGTKLFKNSMKYDIKFSLGIIEKKSNAVIEYMF